MVKMVKMVKKSDGKKLTIYAFCLTIYAFFTLLRVTMTTQEFRERLQNFDSDTDITVLGATMRVWEFREMLQTFDSNGVDLLQELSFNKDDTNAIE